MNVDWVIPCRFVEVHDNLGTIVGAGLDTFWVSDVPATIGLMLAVRMTALEDEIDPDVQHTAVTRVRDVQGEVLSEVAGSLAVGGESGRSEWLTGILLASLVQFEVREQGTYTIEFAVDDASASVPIHVIVDWPPPG